MNPVTRYRYFAWCKHTLLHRSGTLNGVLMRFNCSHKRIDTKMYRIEAVEATNKTMKNDELLNYCRNRKMNHYSRADIIEGPNNTSRQ